MSEFTENPKQLIDLYAPISPAVLSGIFGCNVQMLYQYRQDGKLPPNTDANYRDCIKHHLDYWKTKSVRKASNLQEAALLQDTQLKRAKTEREWLAIKKERGELVDITELALTFEPYFIAMRSQLVSLGRKHPEIQDSIDGLLSTWQKLGEEITKQAAEDLDTFITEQMEVEIDTGDSK